MARRVWVTVRRSVQIQAKRAAASVTGTDLIMNQTGSRFILPANEVLTHDADGNLTSDGHWTYTWDAENRLIAMEEKTSTRQPPGLMVRQRLEFRYDAGGRRVAKKVLHAEGNGNFVLKSSQVFLYDGWNMIGEFILQNSSFSLQRSYEWGPDVSGSFTGAGGVGGLILIKQPSTTVNNSQPSSTVYAPLYDGNGNITELCALSTSTVAARYEYSAFGETITTDGSATADSNPFRFSTKYEDRETGFYYYGYRYYAPETGRWLSRDPIGEEGGLNLYGMVGNDAVNKVDVLGLFTEVWTSIDLTTANNHYRGAGGNPVRIDFDLVDTSAVKIADDFNEVEEWLEDQTNWTGGCTAGKKSFPDTRYGFTTTGTGDATLVLGDITLKFSGNVEIDCKCKYTITGTLKSFDDTYDFNMDAARPWRSLKTIAGSGLAGSGTAYQIEIRGSKQVNESGTQGYIW